MKKMKMKTLMIIIVVTTLFTIAQVKSECFELVQQYYECKNLIMRNINNPDSFPEKPYEPNPFYPNNKLNNTFYKNLNLDKMSFDQAMEFFRAIYNDTFNNSTTDFYKCVSTGIINEYKYGNGNSFSTFFLNETNFKQMKTILSEFIIKFESNLLPYSSLKDFFASKSHGGQYLPSLAQFCMKFDYTDDRFNYYYDPFDCYLDDTVIINLNCFNSIL